MTAGNTGAARKGALSLMAATTLVAATLAAAGPSFAHESGSGSLHPSTMETQEQQFEGVAARNAANKSNAPTSYAPCRNGMAAKTYPCRKVDLLSHLPLEKLGLSFANDIWGWTDRKTGRDYALSGGTEGTVFVDISDPKRPDVVGMLPTHTSDNEFWRDIKVYKNHAFIVSEDTGHGMQVFDLTRLRGVTGAPKTFTEDAHYSGFSSAHNININRATGYAYVIGSDTYDGGLHIVDISDPKNPVPAGGFAGHGYVHDTQCVIYSGPDADHQGKEICFSSAAQFSAFSPEGIDNTVSIVDVTDKANPVPLSNTEYDRDGYSHQGWLTPNQRFFLHGDELDEYFWGDNTSTRVWDVRDLDAPSVANRFMNSTTSIDHNLYTEGRWAFASNYTSGLRVLDARRPAAGLSEYGFFDVYPENDDPTFEGGTWSNYPYFRQKGVVAVNTMDRGLFILKPRLGKTGN